MRRMPACGFLARMFSWLPGCNLTSLLAREDGGSLVEVAVLLPFFVFLLLAMIDISHGYYSAIEVNDAAEAGALYGSLHPEDASGMISAAILDAANLKGGVHAEALWGCECPDGSGRVSGCVYPPNSCSTSYVSYVQVTTGYLYQPLLPYPGIPSSFALKGIATMRSVQ